MSNKTILDNLFDARKKTAEIRKQEAQSEKKLHDNAEKFLNRIAEDLIIRLPETLGIPPMFCPSTNTIRLRDHSGIEHDYDMEYDYEDEVHFHACIPLSLSVGSLVGDKCYVYNSYLEQLRKNGYVKDNDCVLSQSILSDPHVLAFCEGLSEDSIYETYSIYANGSENWKKQKAERLKERMGTEAEKKFPGYSKDFIAGSRASAEYYKFLTSKDAYEARSFASRYKEVWLVVCLAMSSDTIEIMARTSCEFDPPSNEMNRYKWPVKFTFDNNADVSRVSTRILSLLKNKGEEPKEESTTSFSPC